MNDFKLSDSEVFSILFNGISEGALIVNHNQKIVELNKAAATMFGYNELDELKGQHINTLIPKKYHKQHDSHVKSFIKEDERRQMGAGRSIFGLKKSGETFPVEAGLNPFEIEGKKFVMTLITGGGPLVTSIPG